MYTAFDNSNGEPVCGGTCNTGRNRDQIGEGVGGVAMATTAGNLYTSSNVTGAEHINQIEKSARGEHSYHFKEEKVEMETVSVIENCDTQSMNDQPVAIATSTNDDDRTMNKKESIASVVINAGDTGVERDKSESGDVGDAGDAGDAGEPATVTNTSFISNDHGESHPKDILFFMRDQQSQDQIKQVQCLEQSFLRVFVQPHLCTAHIQ